jgi:hypothetical protein
VVTRPIFEPCIQNFKFERHDTVPQMLSCVRRLDSFKHGKKVSALGGRLVEKAKTSKRRKSEIPQLEARRFRFTKRSPNRRESNKRQGPRTNPEGLSLPRYGL